jgi:hypothetical protein
MVPIRRWRTEHDCGIRGNEHHPQRSNPLGTKDDVVGQIRFIERTLGIAA